MAIDRRACPNPEALAAWIDGGLAVDARSALEAHLALCERCRSVVALVLEAQDVVAGPPRVRGRTGVAIGWVAGVAVVTMAAVLIFGVVPRRARRRRAAASKLADLVDADDEGRRVGVRLTSGPRTTPMPMPMRSGGSSAATDYPMFASAVRKIRKD